MIEIGATAELSHPAERVWLALTDPGLLAKWFVETEPATDGPGRLLLRTAELPGFDAVLGAEVTEWRAPERVELRCDEAGRLTRLTCTITPTAEGCRLVVGEVLEHGSWSDDQRDRREEHYRQVLTVRLPAILDWLAFQQVNLRPGDAGVTAEFPAVAALGDKPGRGRRPLLVAVLSGAVLATGVAAWAVLPAEPDGAAGSAPVPPPPTATSSAASSSPLATPSGSRRATARTSVSPSRASTSRSPRTSASSSQSAGPLTARYRTVSTRLFGYTGEVVVDNPAGAQAKDWSVVVTLAEGSTVASASGAQWRQEGQTVTFTGPPSVPAGQSRTLRFDVRGGAALTGTPQGCTVDGNPCTGV